MITQNQYKTFNINFFADKSMPNKKNTKINTLRYGQAFCNEFDITDPDLFYEENTSKAIDIIFKKYIDKGE